MFSIYIYLFINNTTATNFISIFLIQLLLLKVYLFKSLYESKKIKYIPSFFFLFFFYLFLFCLFFYNIINFLILYFFFFFFFVVVVVCFNYMMMNIQRQFMFSMTKLPNPFIFRIYIWKYMCFFFLKKPNTYVKKLKFIYYC